MLQVVVYILPFFSKRILIVEIILFSILDYSFFRDFMSIPKNPSEYRSDIDGLRSIAVLSVILYHVQLSAFEGGFVGVDVFFVISGYLITRLIVKEVSSTGGFRFGNFYLRRIRRLFPAMFLTILLSLLFAVSLFSTEHLLRFGGAAISAVFSFSNVFFWTESGYFDSAADVKPLLHTWSLSVEEQFYLIWPAILVALLYYVKRLTFIALCALAAVSFALNYTFFDGEVTSIARQSE